jgi:hypothetical protein
MSRQIVDDLLPILEKFQVDFTSADEFEALVRLFYFLSPTAFRPVDAIVKLLWVPRPADDRLIGRWLSLQLISFRTLILNCKEDILGQRAEQVLNEMGMKFENSLDEIVK